MIEESAKWTLHIGCWRPGDITSRDSDTRYFNSREEALADKAQAESFYKRFRYELWHCSLISPDGKKEILK